MRIKWRRALNRRGRYWVLALLESVAYSRDHRRPILVWKVGPYWYLRTFRGTNFVASTFRWEGPEFWNNLTADLLFYRYRPRSGDVVVDVGAGMGEEVPCLCLAVSPGGRVIAIEAHPFTYEGLVRTIRLNRLANCVPVAAAISDRTGVTQISDLDDLDANSTIAGSAVPEAQISVVGFTLDDLMDRMAIERVDLLKMNIEGAERLAIKGMSSVLRRTTNVVISCHDFLAEQNNDDSFRTKELIAEFLTSAGFQVERRSDERDFVADYVYATKDVIA